MNSISTKELIKLINLKSRFSQGVVWNIGSLIILGICGILLNIIIAKFFGSEVLGIFNQVYAFYILASQFAVGGIHFSVLKYTSQFFDDRKKCDSIISSALVLTAILSISVAGLIFLLKNLIGLILNSESVAKAIVYVVPAIIFFALNKVLLSVLNGFRHMKTYAVAQALRFIFIITVVILIFVFKMPGYILPVAFTGAELLLFILLIIITTRIYSFTFVKIKEWIKNHVLFGIKIILSGALAEINTRVDVIMLGIFVSDQIVGVYSFAAMIAEGASQIYVAVRANINPVLTRLYTRNKIRQLTAIIKKGVRLFYLVMSAIGLATILLYPPVLNLLVGSSEFSGSWYVFIILMVGIAISSGYLPFNMLLSQTGFPAQSTLIVVCSVLVNIVLNLALIPLFGMYGAALATAISFIFSAIILKVFVKRLLHITI